MIWNGTTSDEAKQVYWIDRVPGWKIKQGRGWDGPLCAFLYLVLLHTRPRVQETVPLKQHSVYYVEVLHHEDHGNDFVRVGMDLPSSAVHRPITKYFLLKYVPRKLIFQIHEQRFFIVTFLLILGIFFFRPCLRIFSSNIANILDKQRATTISTTTSRLIQHFPVIVVLITTEKIY